MIEILLRRFICDSCNKEYFLNPDNVYNRKSRNHPNLCFECMKDHKIKSWKNTMNNKSDEEKETIKQRNINNLARYYKRETNEQQIERIEKMKETRKNKSDEEKESIKEKQKNTINSKSDEEKEAIKRKISNTFNNKTPKEKKIRSINISNGIRNMSPEAKKRKSINSSIATIRYMKTLSKKDKKKRYNKASNTHKERYRSMSQKELKKLHTNQRRGLKKYYENLRLYPNKTELSFIEILDKYNIRYEWQYDNKIEHEDFEKIFPFNSFTKGCTEWGHYWDFILYTNSGNILVDIDGSIHYNNTFYRYAIDGTPYANLEYNKFKDSQRPYQTITKINGIICDLPAFIIECYNNKLTDDTKVYEIKNDVYMTYKEFLNHLKYLNSNENLIEVSPNSSINNSQ